MCLENFNPAWIMAIVAVTALLSAILVAVINNFWTSRNEKRKQQHDRDTLYTTNTHEIDLKKIELLHESKVKAINDFMMAVGNYVAFDYPDDDDISDLHSTYSKALPYICEKTAIVADALVFKGKCEDKESLIKLAKSLRDNDITLI